MPTLQHVSSYACKGVAHRYNINRETKEVTDAHRPTSSARPHRTTVPCIGAKSNNAALASLQVLARILPVPTDVTPSSGRSSRRLAGPAGTRSGLDQSNCETYHFALLQLSAAPLLPGNNPFVVSTTSSMCSLSASATCPPGRPRHPTADHTFCWRPGRICESSACYTLTGVDTFGHFGHPALWGKSPDRRTIQDTADRRD
jgi:hypothetical protein